MAEKIVMKIARHKKLLAALFLAGMGFVYYLPRLLMDGIPHYLFEDTYFHLNRIIGLHNVWLSPVNFQNFAQNGPAVNIFYPWLTMYPMYIFYLLTGSCVTAYKMYYLVLTVFWLLIMPYVGSREVRSQP